jgi:histone deacetylase 1/2
VFIEQPPGFSHPTLSSHVYHLHKSIYGLKQAPRAWYTRLSDYLISLGFRASNADPSLFTLLNSEFKIRDLGSVHYFLGIEVTKTAMGLMLSQHKYTLDIIQRAGMSLCKGVDTPASSSSKPLLSLDTQYSDPTRYRQIVGALQYLTFTRSDICYPVNKVCHFMHSLTDGHWSLVKRIVRYLQGTTSYGLHITRGSSLSLHGFIDADWANSLDDRKSTGGYLVYLGRTLISWKSGKQCIVAHSSTKAEYKALADGTTEILRIRALLSDLHFSSDPTTILWCDNLGATYLSVNPIFHARTKHVEVDYHFVRDRVAKKDIEVQFISSKDQLADVLTKPLPHASFTYCRSKLHVDSPPSA